MCCDDAKYVVQARDASKYVFVREHSLEWNEPQVVFQTGTCMGVDPCMYVIQDNPNVMYYDDPMFNDISDRTRWCNEWRTCMFGGRGEVVRFTSTCFYGLCFRSSWPLPCVPVCFPVSCLPCAREREIYLDDAAAGIHEIKSALRNAREHDPLYHDGGNTWNPNAPDGERACGASEEDEDDGARVGDAAAAAGEGAEARLVADKDTSNPAWNA